MEHMQRKSLEKEDGTEKQTEINLVKTQLGKQRTSPLKSKRKNTSFD